MNEDVVLPTSLRLVGRRAVVVGGGSEAQRGISALLGARAAVVVVAPEVSPAIEGLADAGDVSWLVREFADADLDDAWYVVAASGDPGTDTAVAQAAEARRIFCVRPDGGVGATAGAPATGAAAGVTVSVHGGVDPRLRTAVRDDILTGLRDGTIRSSRSERTPIGVTLVGGGPGDPELITLAGRRALMEADVVVADRLAPRALLAELASDVELVDVAKLPRGRSAQQEEINRVIVDRALAGKRVVRFKGGDNFVFGRGYEEVIACRDAGVAVTIVPGVSSPLAVPGIAGIPVTHRGVAHEMTIISGHLPPGHEQSLTDWDAVARLRGTLLLMMAVENAPQIAEALLTGGRSPSTPVAFVCDGTMPGERTVLSTLGRMAETVRTEDVRPPAIIVVGDVVAVARPDAYDGPADT